MLGAAAVVNAARIAEAFVGASRRELTLLWARVVDVEDEADVAEGVVDIRAGVFVALAVTAVARSAFTLV